ncbi:MAG: metallophosphoesterase [Niabella sp.]|nr:metallophosphoesterase [Niabella sp.]
MKRKDFLKAASPLFLLLANGNIVKAGNELESFLGKKRRLRFAIASDLHYGQEKTDYDNFLKTIIAKINAAHAVQPFDFCMLNGDIVHNDPKHYPAAKALIEQLKMKWYVTPGNHDLVTADQWMQIWNSPVNYTFSVRDTVFLAATTSDEKGKYICPNLSWMRQQLEQHQHAKNIFIIIHINPAKLTENAVDCPEFLELVKQHQNVRAIFNGHDHDQDSILKRDGIPFVFDAHVGGNWGTEYKGFRIVELLDNNDVLTYIMNPDVKINSATLQA